MEEFKGCKNSLEGKRTKANTVTVTYVGPEVGPAVGPEVGPEVGPPGNRGREKLEG